MQLSLEIMNNLNFVAKKLTTGVTAAILATGAGVLVVSQQADAASVTYNSSTNPAVTNIPVTSTDWSTPPGDTTPYLQIPSFDIANLPAYHQAWAKLTGVTITPGRTHLMRAKPEGDSPRPNQHVAVYS